MSEKSDVTAAETDASGPVPRHRSWGNTGAGQRREWCGRERRGWKKEVGSGGGGEERRRYLTHWRMEKRLTERAGKRRAPGEIPRDPPPLSARPLVPARPRLHHATRLPRADAYA